MKAIIEPLIDFIFNGFLKGAAGGPLTQKVGPIRQLEEDVIGIPNHWRGP